MKVSTTSPAAPYVMLGEEQDILGSAIEKKVIYLSELNSAELTAVETALPLLWTAAGGTVNADGSDSADIRETFKLFGFITIGADTKLAAKVVLA